MARKVLITVPHALCLPDRVQPRRHCDRAAAKLGSALAGALEKRGVDVELEVAPDLRALIDYNRWWSRWWPWRLRVDSKIRSLGAASGEPWVLDVHSFPPKSKGLRGEVVLLTHPSGSNEPLFELGQHLANNGIEVSAVRGSWVNDIQDRARRAGVPSALVEVNETLPKKRYNEIAETIASFLSLPSNVKETSQNFKKPITLSDIID